MYDSLYVLVFVSPDESRGYLGFSTVTPPQRFPFGRDNLNNILVRTFKFGMWVYIWAMPRTLLFYSEISLPFPNSSYLLEPSNPMANAEMQFLRLYNNLNQAIGLQ